MINFDVVDVTEWEPEGEETLGTKPKLWLLAPDGSRWLWKESTWNRNVGVADYRKGDDWAEALACRVAAELGVPTARAALASRGPLLGIVSESVLSTEEEILLHGNELLAEAGLPGDDPKKRVGYTLARVAEVLEPIAPPFDHQLLRSALDFFTGFLVLDACIGNTDRHQANWAVIRDRDARRLAPSFDHASSFGFLLSDQVRRQRLDSRDRGYSVEHWASRARSRFEGSPSPAEVAVEALLLLDRPIMKSWLDAVADLPDLADLAGRIPAERISPESLEFARRVMAANVERLMSHPGLRVQG